MTLINTSATRQPTVNSVDDSPGDSEFFSQKQFESITNVIDFNVLS
jgi:hypothetical protein